MSFVLEEVTSAADFDAIWPVHFQAFRNPYNAVSKFFNPVHTTLDAAIETSKARHVAMWKSSPTTHWVKVTETGTGQVVGAACWDVMENGYSKEQAETFRENFKATQHIEGSEEKKWAEKLIGGLRSAVMERISGPHLELKQIIVHPEYRGKGIARMLTGWGTDIADERGIPTVVVSVPYARPVYEKLGFECIHEIATQFTVPNPSEKWKEWEAEDIRSFLMVRPSGKAPLRT